MQISGVPDIYFTGHTKNLLLLPFFVGVGMGGYVYVTAYDAKNISEDNSVYDVIY